MKLLLTSNGITSSELETSFEKLVNGRTNLKVAIIPTASDPIEWVLEEGGTSPYDDIAKLTKERDGFENWPLCLYYKNKGFDVIFVGLKEDPQSIKEKLHNVDIIDVPGGDANWLLDWAKKSGIGEYLKDLLDNDVIYVASSAGNGLLMPDIGLTWWDKRWKADHIGFGIVDFVLCVHQNEKDLLKSKNNLIELKKNYQAEFLWKIYLVQDGQAIMVDGDTVEHIGPGAKESI